MNPSPGPREREREREREIERRACEARAKRCDQPVVTRRLPLLLLLRRLLIMMDACQVPWTDEIRPNPKWHSKASPRKEIAPAAFPEPTPPDTGGDTGGEAVGPAVHTRSYEHHAPLSHEAGGHPTRHKNVRRLDLDSIHKGSYYVVTM